MRILGLIPSRYGSTRLPGKALEEIKGKSIVQRVYEQASQCKDLEKVIVATDHELIRDHCQSIGAEVLMTSEDHKSGTDRCAEALQLIEGEFDYVINIQGDEPFIAPEQITLLSRVLDGKTQMATLAKITKDMDEILNPNVVKVICNLKGEAIYFSRSTIPYQRDPGVELPLYLKHIGIYAYRSDILEKVTQLDHSSLEIAESLEQLRWLENGYRIRVVQTDMESFGIDTYEDLQKARNT